MRRLRKIIPWAIVVFVTVFIIACNNQVEILATPQASPTIMINTAVSPTVEPTPQQEEPGSPIVWFSPFLPEALLKKITLSAGTVITTRVEEATIKITLIPDASRTIDTNQSVWVYALVAPFPTVMDAVSFSTLQRMWNGKSVDVAMNQRLLMSANTLDIFSALWGKPVSGAVKVVNEDDLPKRVWDYQPSWAIVPFEKLDPRWKVLRVNGLNPLDKKMDVSRYPLAVVFGIQESGKTSIKPFRINLLQSNRNVDRLTSLILTGTTALVRNIALRMEENGVSYPARKIGDLLRNADLTHISNEVPFYEKCPPAIPLRSEARFCSAPSYIQLLEKVGTDIVELTGNHELDWWWDPFRYTLQLYQAHGLKTYGGGNNREDAQQPLLVEDHGNKLAFIGCNAVGPQPDLATDVSPGAAPCDLKKIEDQLNDFRLRGYITIVNFQHFEVEDYKPQSWQRADFGRISEAGAQIVSGSQSHAPQCMAFYGDHFVHYGLGNLFFDQMAEKNRPAFIDKHYFYEGRYISTELITTKLESYSWPRFMWEDERKVFLGSVFKDCDWNAPAYSHN